MAKKKIGTRPYHPKDAHDVRLQRRLMPVGEMRRNAVYLQTRDIAETTLLQPDMRRDLRTLIGIVTQTKHPEANHATLE